MLTDTEQFGSLYQQQQRNQCDAKNRTRYRRHGRHQNHSLPGTGQGQSKVVAAYHPQFDNKDEWLKEQKPPASGFCLRRRRRRHFLASCQTMVAEARSQGRPDRHSGQQRRYHPRQDVREDGKGSVGRRHLDQPDQPVQR